MDDATVDSPLDHVPDPWAVQLVSASTSSAARLRALSRDAARGTRRRIAPGVYADSVDVDALAPEQRHLVRLRALTMTSAATPVFSHWSAAVVLGLPVLRSRLAHPHVLIASEADRHRAGLVQHAHRVQAAEIVEVSGLMLTGVARTVIDIAADAELEEGVIAADAALVRGVPRSVLAAAADLAGPRRAARRVGDAISFAHAGAESAAESRTRVTAYRLGVEVPVLQRAFRLADGGRAFADEWFPKADAVLEIDGVRKYLDPTLARRGAGAAVFAEKRREDDIRAQVRAFGRSGWEHSASPTLLAPVLARLGVHATRPRTSFEAYCEAARAARPRRVPGGFGLSGSPAPPG